MSQFSFNLEMTPRYGREDFLIGAANRQAFEWAMHKELWLGHGLILYGPAACGKTHLAHIWATENHASFLTAAMIEDAQFPTRMLVLENIEKIQDEPALFHFLNRVAEAKGRCLFTCNVAPNQLPFTLADLNSRLRALPAVAIAAPDDALLASVMLKLFADRQLKIGDDIVHYLLARTERSFAAVQKWVEYIDEMALRKKKNITLPFIRQLLEGEAPTA